MGKQFAVLGMGNFGMSLARNLDSLGCEVIAVDASEDRIQEIADDVSYAMCADIQDEKTFRMLGARNLDGVVVALAENLESSILATIRAKEMGAPFVMSKAQNDMQAKILKKLGADMVIQPEREMGTRVAKVLATQKFVDWIELSPEFSLVEVPLPENWVGKCLRSLNVRGKLGINVVGVIRGEAVNVNIGPDEPFLADDTLIMIGANKVLDSISKGTVEI